MDGTGIIQLTLIKGNGMLWSSSGLTKNIINGSCNWNDLVYNNSDTIIIKARVIAGNFSDSVSFSVIIYRVQPSLDEHFDDGDFTNNPKWYGDTSLFAINNFEGNNRLELYDATNSCRGFCISLHTGQKYIKNNRMAVLFRDGI